MPKELANFDTLYRKIGYVKSRATYNPILNPIYRLEARVNDVRSRIRQGKDGGVSTSDVNEVVAHVEEWYQYTRSWEMTTYGFVPPLQAPPSNARRRATPRAESFPPEGERSLASPPRKKQDVQSTPQRKSKVDAPIVFPPTPARNTDESELIALFSPVRVDDDSTPPSLVEPNDDPYETTDDEGSVAQDAAFIREHADEEDIPRLLKNGNKRRKRKGKKKSIGRKYKQGKTGSKTKPKANKAKPNAPAPPTESHDDAPEKVAETPEARSKRLERTRLLIGMFYELSLESPPPEEWGGRYGTFALIMQSLRLKGTKLMTVKQVVQQTYDKNMSGLTYDGKIKHNGGRPVEIKPGSEEETMIADCRESGMSFEDTTVCVNELRDDLNPDNPEFVGINAVRGAFNRMKKIVNPIFMRSQGSDDPASDWCRARHGFTAQMLVRFGLEVDLTKFKEENGGDLPDKFNKDVLAAQGLMIHPNSVLWVDETHRDCVTADLGGKFAKQFRFPRDEQGNYDENGSYQDEAKECTYKYNKQVRLALLCAQKVGDHGRLVGRRQPSLVYTGLTMKSKKDQDVLEKTEIKRVQTKGGSDWVHDPRPNGALFQGDGPDKLHGVAGTSKDALVEAGLATLQDIGALHGDSDKIKEAVSRLKAVADAAGKKRAAVGQSTLNSLITQCSNANLLPGNPPPIIDWRKEAHPYKARYGDEWWKEMKKSQTMRGYAFVTDLVEHIWGEAAKFFADTPHKDTWWVYHDALSIMCEKETKAWMREKGYLKRWILPELGLNDDIGSYGGRPVGNCPEFMPWDACLNQDVHESVRRHCVMSRATLRRQKKRDDPRIFSLATPKLGTQTYLRILHPTTGVAPSPKRIVQDIEGVFKAMQIVADAKGVYVPKLANRTGRRYLRAAPEATGIGLGGPRQKGDHSLMYFKRTALMHADLRAMRKEEREMRERARQEREAAGGDLGDGSAQWDEAAV